MPLRVPHQTEPEKQHDVNLLTVIKLDARVEGLAVT